MSKENNLKDFLADLYQGIVSKKADASKNPQDFRSEIEAIETGGGESDLPVYGGEYVSLGVTLISFYIDGISTPYQAESGMSWAKWCDSKYNTEGWYEHAMTGTPYNPNTQRCITMVSMGDEIIADYTYTTGAAPA